MDGLAFLGHVEKKGRKAKMAIFVYLVQTMTTTGKNLSLSKALNFGFIVTFGKERIWVSKLQENDKLFVKDWKHV